MRRWLAVWLILVPLLFSSFALAQPAPDFRFTDSESGKTMMLSDLRGQVVYLDFWASWCAPCRQSFPFMNELHERYKDRGLRILAVNVDESRDDAERFLETTPADFRIVYDSNASIPPLYNVRAMPTAYYIDHKGQVIDTKMGFRLADRAATEQRLVELLKAAGTY